MKKNKLSAVLITKNEEKNIESCLASLSFCDEVVVVDDASSDRTALLAEKYGARVYKRELKGDFAAQKNFGMEKTVGDWILFVDGDERVSVDLKNNIIRAVETDGDIFAYYIKRRDFWWERELRFGETKKVRNRGLVRLVKKKAGVWYGKVHEELACRNKVGFLDGFLDHYPHPTLSEFIREINNYSSIRANELKKEGVGTNIVQIVLWPAAKFILNYFVYLGFLDGPAGFAYAFLMSFHSFLVRAKLYQLSFENAG
jgi:glycosyltransferase involved in cell wall biosynthesis